MFWNKYPYSNIHDLNLDWIIAKVKELDKKVGTDLERIMQDYINEHLSGIITGAMYSEEDEHIILSIPIQAGTENHVYNVADQTIYVEGETDV